MNIAGFTPTDTILGYSGLVWMGQLLHVFQAPWPLLVLIAGGLIWGLVQTLRGRAALLGTWRSTRAGGAPAPALRRERRLARLQPVLRRAVRGPGHAEAAAQQPAGTAPVPRGFMLVVSAMQDTVQELLPRINGEFVVRPFALFAATN